MLGPYAIPGGAVVVELERSADDEGAAAAFAPVLAGLGPAPAGAAPLVLAAGSGRPGPVLARLDELVIGACAATHAVVHGGAAARGAVAVVVPGASGSGKSTLTAALVQAGWSLLSDELAPIDAGWIEPYPVAPRLRSVSWSMLGLDPPPDVHLRWPVPLDRLGGRAGGRARLGAVVLLDRDGPHGVVPVARAEVLEALCQSCFNLEAGGLPVWRRLVDAVAGAAAVRLGYDTPAAGAALLTRWADEQAG